MTHRGKIARLPLAVRQQLNGRLQDGEAAGSLLSWLNALPETQAVLAASFDGQPINEPNLSAWRQGGFRDWEAHQLASEAMAGVIEDAAQLQGAGEGGAAEPLTVLLTAQIAVKLRRLALADDNPGNGRELQGLFSQVAALRREERSAQWLRLQRERLDWQRLQSKTEREKEFWKWAEKNPELRRKLWKMQEDSLQERKEMTESLNQILGHSINNAKARLGEK
jgi:hypothetical protein